jgi:hypothetical protein
MLNIIIPKFDNKMIAFIEFIFINFKIKILIRDKLEANKILYNCLFINTYLDPIIEFDKQIIKIINKIKFCYLSTCKEIYFVKKIELVNNCIDIKKNKLLFPLFFKESNKIDHIIPPEDTNLEYINLLKLKNKSYDSMVNFNIAYKSYEKFLKYNIENNYCYNIILFINSIQDLFIDIPNYKFFRITIFHNLKNEYDTQLLAGFCRKNKILANIYVGNNLIFFFNINNKRLLWFEKVILLTDIKILNTELFDKLNKYHKVNETILLEKIISVSATDFININLFNFNRTYDFNKFQIFNLTKNYLINNSSNYYTTNKINKKFELKFKKLKLFTENQLLAIRNYNLLITNIDKEIKKNYDSKIAFNLLLKKISIGILCKPENDILNEITIIIGTINNLEFLTNLLILFSNIKNKKIMNKLYIKIIKLSTENKLSRITFECLQKLLSVVMDEESLVCVLDFLIYINSEGYKNNQNAQILNETNLKKIVHTLFFNLSKYVENTSIIEKFNILVADLFDTKDILNIEKLLEINFNEDNNIGLIHFLIFISTNINAYYDSCDKFFERRYQIKRNVEYLLIKDIPTCKLEDVLAIPICNFYLSYQGVPSNDIFSLKSKLVRKICPEINYSIDLNFKNKKKNICFHSNYLNRMHSVFKDRHQIIKGLAEKFNVYYSTFDDLTIEVKYLFGKAKHVKLGPKLEEIKKTLEDLKLDVLVYCEIGMDPKAYFMAHMRLAKKQFNTWGHSDSSGIDTVDYFISSKLYELPYEEAQKHYSEKLILQNSLCTCYINPLSKYNITTFKDRYEFGFTDEIILFFCAQSLFKFNPIYDEYIINILQANKNFVLLILNNESKSKVIKRFNNKFISSQIHVFPMLQHNQYLNLMNISNVILDPYPFGGCNSSFESFSLNKVIVTQESNMINGRFTSGFYKKMNMSHLITHNKEDYIKLAIKLGYNSEYRKSIEDEIKEKQSVLFNDQESIDEWSTLIDNI